MTKSRKTPKARLRPVPKKLPKSAPEESGRVQWSFRIFDSAFMMSAEGDKTAFTSVGKKLRDYESRTWNDIRRSKKRDHSVTFDKLAPEAQARLRHLKLDDVEDLWRFRFTGKQRLWGIKMGDVFRVLWWDPKHLVCPSKKKNT